MSNIYDYLKRHEAEIITTLETLVRAESPSNDKVLVDQCGEVLSRLFYEHLSVTPQTIHQDTVGNHLRFEVGEADEQILVLGHFDTVWDKGRLSYRVENNRIYGPGILDMKAGIVQAIWGLKAIRSLGIPLRHKVVFFCNSDEELGSPTSRVHIEAAARKSKAVLVMEPSEANSGALKTTWHQTRLQSSRQQAPPNHQPAILSPRLQSLPNLVVFRPAHIPLRRPGPSQMHPSNG